MTSTPTLVTTLAEQHPKPDIKFQYGTAGFRTKASVLDLVMYATGLLASLRLRYLGQTIGVMITASHNPPPDNGVKIVDPHGEMLEASWEKHATVLANATPQTIAAEIEKLVNLFEIDLSKPLSVVVARDSRESGPRLQKAVEDGLKALNTDVHLAGLLTTPQLHFLTKKYNEVSSPREDDYFDVLASSFDGLLNLVAPDAKLQILIDAANGIGAPKAEKLFSLPEISKHFKSYKVVNDGWKNPDTLNSSCGADYVKTGQRLPNGIPVDALETPMCSYDGDADRVVFYYLDKQGAFHLLDGDKILTLFAKHFGALVAKTGLDLLVGVVQTAYANGLSTDYLTKTLGVPVECTPTGVKHLHHVATKFDVGIYFEANGHGTVLFSKKVNDSVTEALESASGERKRALLELQYFSKLINQTVGDAISDMLAVLGVLALSNLTPAQWDSEYSDLPNKLAKVLVKDRGVFKTTNAERQLVEPAGMQDRIDKLVAQVSRGRSFVRASGTEDAVRVYAEGATIEDVDWLSEQVCKLVSSDN